MNVQTAELTAGAAYWQQQNGCTVKCTSAVKLPRTAHAMQAAVRADTKRIVVTPIETV
jgi:hypothetical protein